MLQPTTPKLFFSLLLLYQLVVQSAVIHKFSFLLLERTSVSNILTNLLRHKEKDDYLNLCESIESIIIPKLNPIGRL